MTTTTQNAVATRPKAELAVGERGIALNDFDGMWRFAEAAHQSGLAPKQLTSQPAIFIALQLGAEIGLPPMASLQSIAVVNGRPTIWGDAMMAVCRATGELEEFVEWYEENGERLPRNPVTFTDKTMAICRVKRQGYAAAETGFSVADAKTAGLWSKDGPWKQYPARMLKYRARSFALRDQFGDALRGLHSAEEVQDTPVDPVENAKPAQAAPAPDFSSRARKPKQEPPPAPQPTQEPAPVPPPAADPSQAISPLQFDFAKFCEESGVDFDDAMGWMKTTGRWPQSDSAESFSDIPDAVLEKLASAPNDMARLVKLFGKVGGR